MTALLTKTEISIQIINKVRLPSDALIYCRILHFLKLATHWSSDRDTEQIRSCILNSIACYAAFDGVDIVGFGRLVGDGCHVALITDIAVHPNYRGQKIASNLIAELTNQVPYCEKIYAHTSRANGLYSKLGFRDYCGGTMELIHE